MCIYQTLDCYEKLQNVLIYACLQPSVLLLGANWLVSEFLNIFISNGCLAVYWMANFVRFYFIVYAFLYILSCIILVGKQKFQLYGDKTLII